jgi:hypothetical protein
VESEFGGKYTQLIIIFFLVLILTETKISSNDFVSMLSFDEINFFLIAIKTPPPLDKLLVAIDLSHLCRE